MQFQIEDCGKNIRRLEQELNATQQLIGSHKTQIGNNGTQIKEITGLIASLENSFKEFCDSDAEIAHR
jgi:peptidoglycan hydrolase CwlO-like protein